MKTPKTIKEEIEEIIKHTTKLAINVNSSANYDLVLNEAIDKLVDLFNRYSLERIEEYRERSKIESKPAGMKDRTFGWNEAIHAKSAKELEIIKKMEEEK